MLQKISSVFVVYRCKTLTGSLDPTHANGMDKPCSSFCLLYISASYVSFLLQGKSPNLEDSLNTNLFSHLYWLFFFLIKKLSLGLSHWLNVLILKISTVLYVQGNVQCFTHWQTAIEIYLLLSLFSHMFLTMWK